MRFVTASINYGDHLSRSLPAWIDLLGADKITVVTSPNERAKDAHGKQLQRTEDVAREHGVRLFVTDAWTRHDPTYKQDVSHWRQLWRSRGRHSQQPVFNKALALDEAFGFAGTRTPAPHFGEVCISADADCRPVGALPNFAELQVDVLYGCRRYEEQTDASKGQEIVIRGRARQTQHRQFTCVAEGYFQMFRYRDGLRFGSYPAADAYDSDFAEFRFSRPGQEVPNFYVVHQGDRTTTHANWEGRKTARYEARVNA